MAILSTGNTFGATDTVTNTKLNNIADAATFDDPVDNSTLELHTDGKLRIKDAGVTASKLATDALELAYPVGSIYMNASDATNPATLLGFGTWVAFGAGRVPVGIDSGDTDFDTAEETGGAKTHTLTLDEMPAHDHVPNRNTYGTNNILLRRNANGVNSTNGLDNTVGEPDISGANLGLPQIEGSDNPHNNLQPYIVVHMWKRTA
jgi:hypothetical protein